MKQTYIKPETCVVRINTQAQILTLSSVGNEYTSTDVTYSRRNSVWDDDDED